MVRAALRDPRITDSDEPEEDEMTGILVDVPRRKVFADGVSANLTFKEFELLTYLIDHQGETISRRELVELIWDDEDDTAVNERTIDVHIRRLRSKIAGYEDIIRTVRGGGYRFDKHPDVTVDSYQI